MVTYQTTGLTDQDYKELYRLLDDALDWDPTDEALELLQLRLAAELRKRGLSLPVEPQLPLPLDEPEGPS